MVFVLCVGSFFYLYNCHIPIVPGVKRDVRMLSSVS